MTDLDVQKGEKGGEGDPSVLPVRGCGRASAGLWWVDAVGDAAVRARSEKR